MTDTVHLVEELHSYSSTHHRAVFDDYDAAVDYARQRAVEQTDYTADELHESTDVTADLCLSTKAMSWLVWSMSVNNPDPERQ